MDSLPEEVLCHILSFLPTKFAALTSILSKRWHNLWKLVPNLDIDDSVFLHPEQGKEKRVEIHQRFIDFVDSVLALQGDSPIQKFTLKCITAIHPNYINGWICNVLRRGVTDLDLFLNFSDEYREYDYVYQLPEEMFISTTLANLKLRSEASVDWWYMDGVYRDATLPMLKSLEINSDFFYCQIEDVLPSLLALEELQISIREWNESDITLSSPSLLKLRLNLRRDFQSPDDLSFDMPSLLFLSYTDIVGEDYPLVYMPKLLEAEINFVVTDNQLERIREPSNDDWLENDEDDDDDDDDEESDVVSMLCNVVKLMNGIQNVRKLFLSADTLEVLSLSRESMPVFNNLKSLGVSSEEGRGWQAMPILLRKCPHLETITFEGLLHHVTDECGDACDCISREEKGRSLESCPVETIKIHEFRATMKEMQIIKHFLKYFPSLKLMKVYAKEDDVNNGIYDGILEMFDSFNVETGCNVQLLVSK